MDIKEAVEIVRKMRISNDNPSNLFDKDLEALQTLIDYCSEPKQGKLKKEDFCWGHKERTGEGWFTNGICNDCGKPSYKNIPKYISTEPTKEVSEPKVELESKAVAKFIFRSHLSDGTEADKVRSKHLAKSIVSHFKLSVPSVVSKKDISNIIYAWEGKHYPISSLTDSIYRLFMKGKTHEK